MSEQIGSIRACGHRVIIEPENAEKKTESGIVIPEKERAEQEIGTLVAIGNCAWEDYETAWAQLGDRVLYSKYGGRMVDDPASGVRYRILNDTDIIAVIETDAEVPQEHYDGDTSGWDMANLAS